MTAIEDLEAQLREGLDRGVDRDIVTVYGDQLQALEDPRGELIAIDLEVEASGGTPSLAQRRSELIERWLGSPRPNGTLRYGFFELDATSATPVEQVRLAFASPVARFTRSIIAVGPPKMLREALDAIAEAPRPFLSRVTLRLWSELASPVFPALDRFVSATPCLQTLEIDARRLIGRFGHPSLRRLRISGFDALGALAELPQLVELDLALHCHLASSRDAPPETVLAQLDEAVPKLVTLDLSRNEPGYLDPHNLGGTSSVFALLAHLGCRAQLTTLVVPPPPDPAALTSLQRATRQMPALRRLAIRRAPADSHPALRASLARDELVLEL